MDSPVGEPEQPGRLGQLEPLQGARKRRMLVIVNPYATSVTERLRRLVVHALAGRFDVDAVHTEARGHATELCREAAHEGYDVIVAFGGDGTVNEAANGLIEATRGRADMAIPPLTCLPGGSANVFARMLGIPGELLDATEHLLAIADRWHPRMVDLGEVNGRCFTFASGVGIDASVVERVDANPRLKARLGAYYFTWAAVSTFTRRYLRNPPRMVAHAGDVSVEGITTIVQNGSPFTYFQNRPIEIAEGAVLDSGTLAGCVLRRASPIDMPSIAWRAFSRGARVARHRQVSPLPELTEFAVRSADLRPLPLQVDGDYIGAVAEARYSIRPGALCVVS